MWKANSAGNLVSNYLWTVFPQDTSTHAIDEQFMLGEGILVSPVLLEGAREGEKAWK